MSEIKREPRFEQRSSPPSDVIDCRTNRDPNKDDGFDSSSNSNSTNSVTVKPELTFSIERILGLNSYRSDKSKNSPNYSKTIHQQFTVSDRDSRDYSTMLHRGYNPHRPSMATATHPFCDEEYEDEDVVDEEDEEDDEYIDVDVDDTTTGSSVPDSDELSFVSGYSKFDLNEAATNYQWLQCTRYHPPKIQRTKKAVAKKRKLGRNPRVPFTPHQVSVLEEKFRRTHYLSSMDVVELSTALTLTETRFFVELNMCEHCGRKEDCYKAGSLSLRFVDSLYTARLLRELSVLTFKVESDSDCVIVILGVKCGFVV